MKELKEEALTRPIEEIVIDHLNATNEMAKNGLLSNAMFGFTGAEHSLAIVGNLVTCPDNMARELTEAIKVTVANVMSKHGWDAPIETNETTGN